MLRLGLTLILSLALGACGDDGRIGRGGSGGSGSTPKPIVGLALSAEPAALEVGATGKLTLTGRTAEGATRDLTAAARFESSDAAVVAVGPEAGTIRALAAGAAEIVARYESLEARLPLLVAAAGDRVVGLAIEPATVRLGIGEEASLRAVAQRASGATADLTASAEWTSADPNIATVSRGVVRGVANGQAVVRATALGQSAMLSVSVSDVVRLVSIALDPSALSLEAGAGQRILATGRYSDGTTRDLVGQATWRSSAPAIATVNAVGQVSALAAGMATIIAGLDGVEAQVALTVTAPACQYPRAGTAIQMGGVMPAVRWATAYDENGQAMPFSLEEFHCRSNWTSVAFIVGAGWCPNCPDYARRVAGMTSQLTANGMLVVYVTAEDRNRRPATSAQSRDEINRHARGAVGLRVGDGESMPIASIFNRAVNAVPGAFVVRKRDMTIIADQGRTQYQLDFVALARQAAGGGGGTPMGACGATDEEPGEPNDTANQATRITSGADIMGGICNAQPDYYRVEATGTWTLDLFFRHADGDLDVYVLDEQTGRPKTGADGRRIGSESTDDDESFSYQGPATVLIVGYQGATARYRLTLR